MANTDYETDDKKAAPRRTSGVYRTPHGNFRSVTTVLGEGVAKPALVGWAAYEVANAALDNLPRLSRVRGKTARQEAMGWLKNAHNVKKDAAAKLGSAVHDQVEALILEQPRPEPTEEQAPFVRAFHNFVEDWSPTFEATEMVVANPQDGWAGTGDWWATIPELGNVMVLGDWKSGKRIYSDVSLQLACYQRATVGWLKDGTEVEPPKADRAVVVHLRPDANPERGYAMYPLDTSDEVYAYFLSIMRAADWNRERSQTVVGDVLAPAETAVA